MTDKEGDELLGIIRLGGYLVLLGVVVGAVIGVYAVVNPLFFSVFVVISQYDAMGFFLSVSLPSFVVIVALGYFFATTLSLDGDNPWRAPSFSILSLICMVLSALSVFNFISFAGGFLVLIGTIYAFTRPTFKALSGREAYFLTETGAVLVASFSTLFLFMLLVSKFVPTYLFRAGEFVSSYPSMFLIMVIISFLMFFVTLFFGLRGGHTGACGAFNLIMIIAVSAIAARGQYVYLNLSGYLGVFMLIAGILSALMGALTYIGLSFSKAEPLEVFEPSQYYGKYCSYCGTPIAKRFQTYCLSCGRRLAWKPGAPFCPYCGRVVPKDTHTCPHCQEALD